MCAERSNLGAEIGVKASIGRSSAWLEVTGADHTVCCMLVLPDICCTVLVFSSPLHAISSGPIPLDRMLTAVLRVAAGKFEQEPIFTATNAGGRYLDVLFEYSDILWPWSGHLALYFRVVPEGDKFQGQATGVVTFSIVSPGIRGESQPRRSNVTMPIQLDIIPTPARWVAAGSLSSIVASCWQ